MRIAFVAVAALALVLAGCSDSSKEAAATTATSSPTSTVSAPSTSPPPVIHYRGATFVTGTEIFTVAEGRVTTHADGSSHSRHGSIHSTFESADPRVAGTAVATWNSDRWGSFDNGALVQWGKMRLKNSGGSWIGRLSGIYTSETSDRINVWFRGTGRYAGLSMYLWEAPTSGANEYPFNALIFRGSPPPR